MELPISFPAAIASEGEIDIRYVPTSPLIQDFPHLQGEHQPLDYVLP